MVFHAADSLYLVNEIFVCYVLSSPKSANKLIRGTHRCCNLHKRSRPVYFVKGHVSFEVSCSSLVHGKLEIGATCRNRPSTSALISGVRTEF